MTEILMLSSICNIVKQTPQQFDGYKEYVATADLQNSEIISSTEVTYQTRPSRADCTVKSGDVLFAKMAATEKTLIAEKIHEDMLFSTGFAILRPIPGVLDSAYLYHVLRSGKFLSEKDRLSSGATQKAITNKALLKMKISAPPLNEQRRIAAILDKADEIAQTVSKTQKMNEEYWKIIFQSNVTALLERWPISRKQHDCPAGWKWARLVDVARLESGHTPSRNRSEWWDGDISWITLGDIRKHDGKIIYETEENTNQLGLENSSARLLPERTVCFARTASVGFATIMGKEMATSQDFVNFVCGSEILPEYLLYSFLSSREWLLSIANGSTHKTIYYPVVKSLYIAIPPLNIQEIFTHLFNHQQQATESMEERLAVTDLLRLASASELFSTNNSLSVAQEMLT